MNPNIKEDFMARWLSIPIKDITGRIECNHATGQNYLLNLARDGWEVDFGRGLAIKGQKSLRVIYANVNPYKYAGLQFGGMDANPEVLLTFNHFLYLMSRVVSSSLLTTIEAEANRIRRFPDNVKLSDNEIKSINRLKSG
jgi:hypothetical protein